MAENKSNYAKLLLLVNLNIFIMRKPIITNDLDFITVIITIFMNILNSSCYLSKSVEYLYKPSKWVEAAVGYNGWR